MEIKKIYCNPTKYNLGKYGEVCQNNDTIFIQVSKDPETSNWLTLGELMTVVYQDSVSSDDFILKHLEMYESKNV